MSESHTQGHGLRFCENCGFEHGGKAKFCPQCGTAQIAEGNSTAYQHVPSPASPTASPPPPPPPPPAHQTTPPTAIQDDRRGGPLQFLLLSLIILIGIIGFISLGQGFIFSAIFFALVTGLLIWLYRALMH